MEENKVPTMEDIKDNFDKLNLMAYGGRKIFYKQADKYWSPFELKRDRTLFTEITAEEYDSYVKSVNGVYPGEYGQLMSGDCVCDVEFGKDGEVKRYWKFDPEKHGAEEVFAKANEVYPTLKEFKEKYCGLYE